MLDHNIILIILQASSLTMTLGLALILFFSWFHQLDTSREYEQMRWLIMAALLLLALHYVLQIVFGFRAQGADVGALINMLFYAPAIYVFSYSFIRLAGRRSFQRRYIVVTSASLLFIAACFIVGYVHYGSLHMPAALYAMGACFFLSILFCFVYPTNEINRMRKLADDESDQLQVQYNLFLKTSSRILYATALLMAIGIYFTPMLLFVGTMTLIAMLFFVVSFIALGFNIGSVNQIISTEMDEVTEAGKETVVEEVKPSLTNDQKESISTLIADWKAQQGYGAANLNSSLLAARLNISKRLLVQYLREVEGKTFRVWLSDLRLEEAKQLIIAHPEYSNETIAEACGFSRSHLQVKFKESTGLTTNDWREAHTQT
ncbi:MAG: helix-turn-helix domain-containing protein [Bacteroidaceae bacterium]|nr:helix-turn-helix domain-containing protein [Bacteroidaceae bacterium]